MKMLAILIWMITSMETTITKMSLSTKTVRNIADVLKSEVINHIYENESYVSMMQQVISEALDAKMGEMDDEIHFDLTMILFDTIELKWELLTSFWQS